MPRIRWWSVLLVLTLAISLSGCGRLLNAKGAIQGSVVDQNGAGIAGALVTVAGTTLATSSDAQGRFTISNVPAGTRTLTVAKNGYIASASTAASTSPYTLTQVDGDYFLQHNGETLPLIKALAAFNAEQDAAQHAESSATPIGVTVQVPRSGSVQAQVTMMLADISGINNVAIYDALPAPRSELTMGRSVDFRVDFQYSLTTASSGAVYFLIEKQNYFRTQTTIAQEDTPISKGVGNQALATSAYIPADTTTITPVVLIVNDSNQLLACTILADYSIANAILPDNSKPVIHLVQATTAGVELAWEPGPLRDFKSYQIKRNGRTIATITDPAIRNYTDTLLLEGDNVQYSFDHYYGSGYLSSNAIRVKVPAIGWTVLPLTATATNLVLDPLRPYVYGSIRDANQLIRISTATNSIDKTLPVCPGPDRIHISAAGNTAVVSCSKGDSVAVVNLADFTLTRVLRDFNTPRSAVIDSVNNLLYVLGGSDGKLLYTYNLSTNQVSTQNLNTTFASLQLNPDGHTLYLRNSSSIRIYQASDMSILHTITTSYEGTLNTDGSKLYAGGSIYNARSPWTLLNSGNVILGLSAAGDRLITKEYNSQMDINYLTTWTFDGSNRQKEYAVYLSNSSLVYGAVIYNTQLITARTSEIVIADLAQRQPAE